VPHGYALGERDCDSALAEERKSNRLFMTGNELLGFSSAVNCSGILRIDPGTSKNVTLNPTTLDTPSSQADADHNLQSSKLRL